jgi:hypothetical protein
MMYPPRTAKILTVAELKENFKVAEAQYDERKANDAEFGKAALTIGEWLADNFSKCSYRMLARFLVREYKKTKGGDLYA